MQLRAAHIRQLEGRRRQGRELGPLDFEERERRPPGGAVLARAGPLPHPLLQPQIGRPQLGALQPSEEGAGDEVDPRFDFPLVLGRPRPIRADEEAVMMGEAAVGFAQDRVVQGCLEDRCLEVVEHHLANDPAEAFEGAPVQPQPRRDALVHDQLGVLVPAEREGHDEDVASPQDAVFRVDELAGCAEVDLRLLPGRRVHAHRHVRRLRSHPGDEASQRGVAPSVAVVGAQPIVDCLHLDALLQHRLDHAPVRLQRGDGLRWPGPLPRPPLQLCSRRSLVQAVERFAVLTHRDAR